MSAEVKTHCKFCGKEIVMHLHEDWQALGRTLTNLLPLVCCNPCGKWRVTLRQTAFEINSCCQNWSRLSIAVREQVSRKIKERLARLVMDHLSALANIRRVPCPDYDVAIVEQLMDSPERWFETLKKSHDLVRQATLPYKDQ